MQKVLLLSQLGEVADCMDKAVIDYIDEGQIETFESFESFDIIAFDWFDTGGIENVTAKILIYIDENDLFVFCENETAQRNADAAFKVAAANERALYDFFVRLLKNDMDNLEALETRISDTEDAVITGRRENYIKRIIDYRKTLLRQKLYYQQLGTIFEYLIENDNGLLSKERLRYFVILNNRVNRFLAALINLKDAVAHVQEAYQAQIDIEQNKLMKVFTVVTSIFMPLTLLVGWYGMNFDMPEFRWKYGYLSVGILSIVICIALAVFFRKKRWLK